MTSRCRRSSLPSQALARRRSRGTEAANMAAASWPCGSPGRGLAAASRRRSPRPPRPCPRRVRAVRDAVVPLDREWDVRAWVRPRPTAGAGPRLANTLDSRPMPGSRVWVVHDRNPLPKPLQHPHTRDATATSTCTEARPNSDRHSCSRPKPKHEVPHTWSPLLDLHLETRSRSRNPKWTLCYPG